MLFDALVGIVGSATGATVGISVGDTAPAPPASISAAMDTSRILAIVFKVKKVWVIFVTPSV